MQLDDIQSIRRCYDHVYISPHFDDVAASCAGRIINQKQAGKSVLVVTIFSSRAYRGAAKVGNQALQAMLDYDRRRLEDTEAMQQLGVDFLWLEFPEVLFRRQAPWRRYGLTYPKTNANQDLCRQVAIKLTAICRQTQCAEMVLPLGIGQHVDHQILFQAGLGLHHNSHGRHSLLFYEEIPYALFPFLLNYRLKKIVKGGIELRQRHQVQARSSQVSAQKLVYLLTAMPSLGLHLELYRPGLFLLLKAVDLCVRFLVRPATTFFSPSQIKPVVEDITPAINPKVAAISAYGSQLSDSGMDARVIRKWLTAYSMGLGLPAGFYGELYWHVS